MKTLYTIVLLLALSASAFAQQLPNSDFENWDSVNHQIDPVGYWTPDSANVVDLGSPESVEQSTDSHSGLSSVKLITVTTNLPPTVGTIVLGNSLGQGIPFTGKPTSIKGWTKSSLNNEIASISVGLFNNGILISGATASFAGNYDWTEFEAFFDTTSQTPDAITLTVNMSGGNDGELLIDDLVLDYTNIGIENVAALDVTIYPNPTTDAARIYIGTNAPGFSYNLTDVSGRVLQQGEIKNGVAFVNPHAPGMYFINVVNSQGKITGRQKLMAQ